MWSDAEIDAALDAAQFAFVRYSYLKRQWHLISGIYATVSGASPLSIPTNYMMYASAEVESPVGGTFWPASLKMGYGGKIFDEDPDRATAFIGGQTVIFRRGVTQVNGRLHYYRRPTKISGASNHTEMNDTCYDAIVYHAAALLQQKDYGQCQRALKSFAAVMSQLVDEPLEMYPPTVNQNSEA